MPPVVFSGGPRAGPLLAAPETLSVKKTLTLLTCLLISGVALAQASHLIELGQKASKLRQLSYVPVPSKVVSQQECSAYLLRLLDKEMVPSRTRVRESFLKHLGLMPKTSSMKKILADLYTDQVRGLYDPAQKRYLVVSGGGTSEAEASVGGMAAGMGLNMGDILTVHELCHAIQDQHFNLSTISESVAANADQEMAADSLIEGDATVLMMDYAMSSLGVDPSVLGGALPGMDMEQMMMGQGGAVARAPHYFQSAIGFPYSGGMAFVSALKRRGGWATVNRAFASLPESTEQILHPEKYGVDHPKPVTEPAPPRGATALGSDTAGEFEIRQWARENSLGDASATGWGGDRYAVYDAGGTTFVVWATTWDNETAAMRFEAMAKKALAKGRGPMAQEAGSSVWTQGALVTRCAREGPNVTLWIDAPAAMSS